MANQDVIDFVEATAAIRGYNQQIADIEALRAPEQTKRDNAKIGLASLISPGNKRRVFDLTNVGSGFPGKVLIIERNPAATGQTPPEDSIFVSVDDVEDPTS